MIFECEQLAVDYPELYKEIVAFNCPLQCNDNGYCIQGRILLPISLILEMQTTIMGIHLVYISFKYPGKCLCLPGYVGSDCSVAGSADVTSLYLKNEGLCDVMGHRNCTFAVALGTVFIEGPGLTCHLQPVTVGGLNSIDLITNI